jgi:hypothetical protein
MNLTFRTGCTTIKFGGGALDGLASSGNMEKHNVPIPKLFALAARGRENIHRLIAN